MQATQIESRGNGSNPQWSAQQASQLSDSWDEESAPLSFSYHHTRALIPSVKLPATLSNVSRYCGYTYAALDFHFASGLASDIFTIGYAHLLVAMKFARRVCKSF